jgi:hypothetical protein
MPASPFDPTWRDDVVDLRALDFDLVLPEPAPRRGKLWVARRPEREEVAFGRHHHRHDPPRWVTSLVMRSPLIGAYALRDESGNTLPEDHPLHDLAFTPKAWMSDTLEERCMMLAAASEARGDVLVGGLGLGVYPQMAFALGRPVRSVTIVEESAEVLGLVHPGWMQRLAEPQRAQVRVVHASLQHVLAEAKERYDTIFLDVWSDADPRVLPLVNGLIAESLPRCAEGGRIHCWGYASMVDCFVRDAVRYVEEKFPLHEYHLDPLLERFAAWADDHQGATPEELAEVARRLAHEVCGPVVGYDRERYLTSYAASRAAAHAALARARKSPAG